MALITSYTTLQSEVADWLNRSDLTTAIQTFIQLADKRIARDLAGITSFDPLTVDPTNAIITDHPDVYLYATLVESAPYLKDDPRVAVWKTEYAERIERVRRARTAADYDFSTFGGLQTAIEGWLDRDDLVGAVKSFVALAERKFIRDPRVRDPDGGTTSVTALTTSGSTNWLLTNHPDIYLYGALVEAAPYLGEDPRVEVWKLQLEERLNELSGSVRVDPTRSLGLTSYAELQRMVADYLDRGDLENVIPHLVTLAEAKFKRDIRIRNLTSQTLSISSDDLSLPATLERIEAWYFDGDTYFGAIETVGADQIGDLKVRYGKTGVPRFAAIIDGAARFAPAPDSTYSTKLVFWEKLTALSAGVNWLYENHPDIYLYGTLVEAEPYLKRDDRVVVWKSMLEEAIQSLDMQTTANQSGGTLRRQFKAIG